MTKSKKWIKIAKAYLTPYENRTKHQIEITEYGLCGAYDSINNQKFEYKKYGKKEDGTDDLDYYYVPCRESFNLKPFKLIYDEWRGMFALLMAEAVKIEKDW